MAHRNDSNTSCVDFSPQNTNPCFSRFGIHHPWFVFFSIRHTSPVVSHIVTRDASFCLSMRFFSLFLSQERKEAERKAEIVPISFS